MTREEAIDLLDNLNGMIEDSRNSDYDTAFKMAIKALEHEPKTGRWIYDRTRDWDGECKYECSECGMGSDVDYAYCMRCGAKMIESQESEDKE